VRCFSVPLFGSAFRLGAGVQSTGCATAATSATANALNRLFYSKSNQANAKLNTTNNKLSPKKKKNTQNENNI
jgi:hypothetical protein